VIFFFDTGREQVATGEGKGRATRSAEIIEMSHFDRITVITGM